jgi:YbbR domain-containing protein
MRLLTEHWELKLVALVIAIALWLYTSGQVRMEKSLTVTVPDDAVQALPKGFQVTAIQPREFTVKVNVPVSLLHNLKAAAVVPALELRADALGDGTQTFPITSRILGLDDSIRIERIEPETVKGITVTFGAVVDDYLPIEVPPLVQVPNGLVPTVALDRTRVRVQGAKEELDAAKARNAKVAFAPIFLGDIDPLLPQAREEKLKLIPAENRLTVKEEVTATITLKPVTGARQVVSLPVLVLAGRDFSSRYQLELSQPQVALTVRGPENLLKALRPEVDLVAYVNLKRVPEPNVALEVPVNLLAPAWLTYDPATVRITASLIQTKPESPTPGGGEK